jgi:hypothetical protein
MLTGCSTTNTCQYTYSRGANQGECLKGAALEHAEEVESNRAKDRKESKEEVEAIREGDRIKEREEGRVP